MHRRRFRTLHSDDDELAGLYSLAKGNLLPCPYIVLTAAELRPTCSTQVYTRSRRSGGGHHERNPRQGAEIRTSCHLGGWHSTGAESSASPGPRKVATAVRTETGRAGQAR